MTLLHTSDLTDVPWPDDAVFVVDDALPPELIAPLSEPTIEVDAGESLKDLERIGELAEQILALRSSRPLTLVAVGGGSVGDALGFVASILWRGVDLWHVPTTLVAMVDSAHGGKTAVNLKGHKNQLGTFHRAEKVVVARSFLEALPLDLREEGLVELIKVLWLEVPEKLEAIDDPHTYRALLVDDVETHRELWTELVDAAVDAKQRIVDADPRERSGHRRILNLGHTAGHGLEARYDLTHGRAVAWGLAACAHLSVEHADFCPEDAERLLTHLDPLLVPLPDLGSRADRDAFVDCLQRDKKRRGRRLISILLDGPGRPVQTDEIDAEHWWRALRRTVRAWRARTLSIHAPDALREADLDLPCDKSRHNRAAAIAHLRPGPTQLSVAGGRPARDAVHLGRALQRLTELPPDAEPLVQAGDGGTTGRFLLAIAAHRSGTTHLQFGPSLRRRPHGPLVDALRRAGAQIESTDEGYRVVGWSQFPDELSVDPSMSSQFASALALLAIAGQRFDLHLERPPASRPYFEMTVSMLKDAGVDVTERSDTIRFSPTPQLEEPTQIPIPTDTSSTVVWRALAVLRGDYSPPDFPAIDHPDRHFDDIARRLAPAESVTVDLTDCPDLACVLAAVSSLLSASLTVAGASHLRHKESNRIDDLTEAFNEVGLVIDPGPDGFHVPAGIQSPEPGSTFDPRGDHRLAMAALLLTARGTPLRVTDAGCVAKSYPDLWRHARRLGYTITINPSPT